MCNVSLLSPQTYKVRGWIPFLLQKGLSVSFQPQDPQHTIWNVCLVTDLSLNYSFLSDSDSDCLWLWHLTFLIKCNCSQLHVYEAVTAFNVYNTSIAVFQKTIATLLTLWWLKVEYWNLFVETFDFSLSLSLSLFLSSKTDAFLLALHMNLLVF